MGTYFQNFGTVLIFGVEEDLLSMPVTCIFFSNFLHLQTYCATFKSCMCLQNLCFTVNVCNLSDKSRDLT